MRIMIAIRNFDYRTLNMKVTGFRSGDLKSNLRIKIQKNLYRILTKSKLVGNEII